MYRCSEIFQAGHFPQVFAIFPVFIFFPRVVLGQTVGFYSVMKENVLAVTVSPETFSELMGKN